MSRSFSLLSYLAIFFSFILGFRPIQAAEDIYLTMTTSPERIKFIPHIIDTLDVFIRSHEAKIIINVPKYYRNDEEYKKDSIVELKNYLSENKYSGTVVLLSHDTGPISKILPTLKMGQKSPNAIIISLDDDHEYHPKALEALVKAKKAHPNAVFNTAGGVLKHYELQDFPFPKGARFNSAQLNNPERWETAIIEGYSGVAYSPKDFDATSRLLLEFLSDSAITSQHCRLSDDLVLSFVLGLNNIPKYKLKIAKELKPKQIRDAQASGLQNGNGYGKDEKEMLQREAKTPHMRFDSVKYRACLDSLLKLTFDTKKNHFKTNAEILQEIIRLQYSFYGDEVRPNPKIDPENNDKNLELFFHDSESIEMEDPPSKKRQKTYN